MRHYIYSYHPLHILAFSLQTHQLKLVNSKTSTQKLKTLSRLPQVPKDEFYLKGEKGVAVLVVAYGGQLRHQLLVGIDPTAEQLQGGGTADTRIVKQGKIDLGIGADGDFFF